MLRTWKEEQEKKDVDSEASVMAATEDDRNLVGIDLTQFMSLSGLGKGSNERRGTSPSERDVVRRYIEKAYDRTKLGDDVNDDVTRFSDDDGVEFDIERALCNPSAQKFLLSVLSQRCKLIFASVSSKMKLRTCIYFTHFQLYVNLQCMCKIKRDNFQRILSIGHLFDKGMM
jgi:hypothetical protein